MDSGRTSDAKRILEEMLESDPELREQMRIEEQRQVEIGLDAIAQNVRRLREAGGMSQADLAREVKVFPKLIEQMEATGRCTVGLLTKVSTYFQLLPEALMGQSLPPPTLVK